jgi:uncharacterized protein YecT (DUF1311 family)
MLRLTLVFCVWLASTAYALDEEPEMTAARSQEAELGELYERVWSAAQDEQKILLDRAQVAWSEYRAAHCELAGEDCLAFMAHERAAELRQLRLTNTNDRTIFATHECADGEGRTHAGGNSR